MPCYTVQKTQIELGKKTNVDHMAAGLAALGLNPIRNGQMITFSQGSYYDGRLTLTGQNADQRGADIRRAYMTEASKATARRFGFQVKATGPFKYDLIKNTL